VIALGIDEAGRGCVCGNMYIAGVWATDDVSTSWEAAGVKDSKKLERKERDALAEIIKKEAIFWKVIEVTPLSIDENNIDELEFNSMVELIRTKEFDVAVVDCPGARKMWWKCFADIMDPRKLCLEHKADVNFPLVGAASILAKSARDAHVDFLGVPGGGYSNKLTWEYLDKYFDQHGCLPSFTRFRWECVQEFLERKEHGDLPGQNGP